LEFGDGQHLDKKKIFSNRFEAQKKKKKEKKLKNYKKFN